MQLVKNTNITFPCYMFMIMRISKLNHVFIACLFVTKSPMQ